MAVLYTMTPATSMLINAKLIYDYKAKYWFAAARPSSTCSRAFGDAATEKNDTPTPAAESATRPRTTARCRCSRTLRWQAKFAGSSVSTGNDAAELDADLRGDGEARRRFEGIRRCRCGVLERPGVTVHHRSDPVAR